MSPVGKDEHRKTLGDVLLRIEAGKSFQTLERLATPKELGVLKVSAVTWSDFRPNEAKAIENYEPDPRHRVCAGDLLLSRANTRELVGAVVLVDKDYPNRLLSDKTLRLVLDESKADSNYLLFALRTQLARAHIERFATGTSYSMRNIAQDAVRAIPVILPPINEQRRIAAGLRAQLAAIETARMAAEAQIDDLVELSSRLLNDAFGE